MIVVVQRVTYGINLKKINNINMINNNICILEIKQKQKDQINRHTVF